MELNILQSLLVIILISFLIVIWVIWQIYELFYTKSNNKKIDILEKELLKERTKLDRIGDILDD